MCPPEWAGGESMWGNVTIIGVDARTVGLLAYSHQGLVEYSRGQVQSRLNQFFHHGPGDSH